jgi:hypothetical protein
VAVADEHRIDISGREDLQQPRHDRLARIYQQPRARLFDQVAAAATLGRRPGTTPTGLAAGRPTTTGGTVRLEPTDARRTACTTNLEEDTVYDVLRDAS